MLSFYSSVIFSDPGDRNDIAKNTAKIIFSDPENENDIPKHTAKVDWLNFGTVLSYPGLITLAFPLTLQFPQALGWQTFYSLSQHTGTLTDTTKRAGGYCC